MNKMIEKSEVVAARQRVSDIAAELDAHARRNLHGLSNEQMVDVELESIDLSYKRDLALKEYQDILHDYHAQEMKEAKATKAPATEPVIEEYEQGRKRGAK